ncbi:hypothetical protein D3C79_856050 [compost metagenome]
MGVRVQLDDRIEILSEVGVPRLRALDQQALERQIQEFDRPAAIALAQFGGGVEVNALEAPAIVGRSGHGGPSSVALTIDQPWALLPDDG